MAHEYGKTTFPVTGSGGSLASLEIVADFFATLIRTYCATAWESIAPGEEVIAKVFHFDPERAQVFHERELPALYVFRGRRAGEHLADDLEGLKGPLVLLWVPPPSVAERELERFAFTTDLAQVISYGCKHEMDPAWVHDPDTYEHKATTGSHVLDAAGFAWWQFEGADEAWAEIQSENERARYWALRVTIDVREVLCFDNEIATAPAAVSVDFEIPDETHGAFLTGEYDDPQLP